MNGVISTASLKAQSLNFVEIERLIGSKFGEFDFAVDYWKELYAWYTNGGVQHVAAYLSEFDICGFDPKAPPLKTSAFWAIADACRVPEDDQLADALDRMGNPDITTLEEICGRADPELCLWLRDRRNSRQIPYRMETVGYVTVRNPADKTDGRWKVGSKRQNVYAKTSLSLPDRLRDATTFVEVRRQ